MSTSYKDRIYTTVMVHLSWWDRMKVLFGTPIYVAVDTDTENKVGNLHSESRAWTHPWRLFREPRTGMGEANIIAEREGA